MTVLNNIKKILTVLVLFSALCRGNFLFAEEASRVTAKTVMEEALKKEKVSDVIDYVNSKIDKTASAADRRSLLYFRGTVEEQAGRYESAQKSYAAAAGIAAGDAAGMKKVTPEQLVINAVRCCLNAGDYETADSYLNSAVRSTKNPEIKAYVYLYSQWSALCRAETLEDASDSVTMLKAFSTMDSLEAVRPAVLFTVWYITADSFFSERLINEYPESVEAAIYKGSVQIASVPFWYFVPHKSMQGNSPSAVSDEKNNSAANKTASAGENNVSAGKTDSAGENNSSGEKAASDREKNSSGEKENSAGNKTASAGENNSSGNKTISAGENNSSGNKTTSAGEKNTSADKTNSDEGKITRQQCGLFGHEENAVNLVNRLKEKGFKASIVTEKRASGRTYYIVVVDENADGTMGLKLRDAGFECYPVVE